MDVHIHFIFVLYFFLVFSTLLLCSLSFSICTHMHTYADFCFFCTVVEGVLGGLRLRQHVLVNRTWMLDSDESRLALLAWLLGL